MDLSNYDGAWCALYVRYKQEFSSARLLAEKGYEVFAPFYSVRRRWSDRWKNIHLPLFAGYVFCRLKGAGAAPLLLTPGVIRIIGTSKVPSIIPEHEIAAIQSAIKSGYNIQPCDYVEVGSRVRIVGGPLDGVEGLVESRRNQHRLVLSVERIRGSVVVELGGYVPLETPVPPATSASAA
jgi:transcription antitermination factor NusG